MTESHAYIGVATPQANPTVELEFREFYRGTVCAQVTRLTSAAAAPNARLCDYLQQVPAALASYDTLRLAAFAFACTGSAYLLGAAYEAELTSSLEDQRGHPVITANQAIDSELNVRGVKRIAMLAPYPEDLCAAAVRYWEGQGFTIAASERIDIGADTRGIYALTDREVSEALDAFDVSDADVLLLSGTGMPTLGALRRPGLPIVSSNLCLATEALRRIGRWPAEEPANIDRLCGTG